MSRAHVEAVEESLAVSWHGVSIFEVREVAGNERKVSLRPAQKRVLHYRTEHDFGAVFMGLFSETHIRINCSDCYRY